MYKRYPFEQERFNQAMKIFPERYAVTTATEDGSVLDMGDACVIDMDKYMAAVDGVSKDESLPDTASG